MAGLSLRAFRQYSLALSMFPNISMAYAMSVIAFIFDLFNSSALYTNLPGKLMVKYRTLTGYHVYSDSWLNMDKALYRHYGGIVFTGKIIHLACDYSAMVLKLA